MSLLSQNLKRLRKERNLSQVQLAKKAGCSQTTISDIERARNTSTKELADIAKALGVPIENLIGKEPIIKPISNSYHPAPIRVQSFEQIISKLDAGRTMHAYIGEITDDSVFYEIDTDLMEGQAKYIPRGAILRIESDKPNPGDIALYNIDSTPAIGVYSKIGNRSYVRPSNSQYPAIDVTEAELIGTVRQSIINY